MTCNSGGTAIWLVFLPEDIFTFFLKFFRFSLFQWGNSLHVTVLKHQQQGSLLLNLFFAKEIVKSIRQKIQFRWNKKGSFGIAALPLYSPRRCLGAWPLGSQVSCMLMLLTRSIHFRWFSFHCKYPCEHNWNTLWEENKGGMNYLWIWISAFDTNKLDVIVNTVFYVLLSFTFRGIELHNNLLEMQYKTLTFSRNGLPIPLVCQCHQRVITKHANIDNICQGHKNFYWRQLLRYN